MSENLNLQETSDEEFPSPSSFFMNVPLYAPQKFAVIDQLISIEYFQGKIDQFCVNCSKETTFTSFEKPLPQARNEKGQEIRVKVKAMATTPLLLTTIGGKNQPLTPQQYCEKLRYFSSEFYCARDQSHIMIYHFKVQDFCLTKIGQNPSLADISSAHLQKYRKVLKDAKFKELNRGVGLVTHGVGIGAFVYLRRIFEGLLDEARVEAAKEPSWDNDTFVKARVDEKITLLRNYLPRFLVENTSLYPILSKGIHELSEEECLEHFDVVEKSIELILDEKINEQEKEKKTKEVSNSLNKIKSKL